MKEMTIEQKAQAYDDAKARMSKAYNSNRCTIGFMNEIFPELRESEDEKIRKALIDYFDDANKADENPLQSYGIHTDKAIAWLEKQGEHANFRNKIQIGDKVTRNRDGVLVNLSQLNRVAKKDEKQGEQKPADVEEVNFFDDFRKTDSEVEPKFKVGDFIVNDYGMVMRITGIKNDKYEFIFEDKLQSWPIVSTDRNCHLWTIQDAKDGNVLACNNGWTCIFKTLVNDETFSSYCFMDNTKWFCETGSECHTLKEEFVKAYNGKIYPATKEQRDLLFQKMKEAGYEWNAEKKELKKIDNEEYNGEDYGIDSLFHAQRILEKTLGKVDGYQSDDGILEHKCAITAIKKLYEQKPAEWSEKDKDNIQRALYYVDYYQTHEADTKEAEECFDWLKSLKPQNNITDEELVQAKKDAYNDALDKIEYHSGEPTFDDGWSAAIDYIRKKYLRPQQQWKPTEAQLSSLTIACDRNDRIGFDLTQLLKELKKL